MTTDPFRDAFERMAPRPVDPSTARAELGALTPGFQKARRFHRIRVGAATAVCALGLAAGGPALLATVGSDGGSQPLDFASPNDSGPDIADAAEVDSDSVDVDESSVGDESSEGDESSAPDHLDSGDSPDSDDEQPLEITGGAEPEPEPEPDGPSTSPDDESDGGTDDVVAVDTADRIKTSEGGSVTYKVVDGAVVLVDYPPAEGFNPEVVTELANEIEVRFVNGCIEWEIEIEIEHGVDIAKSSLSDSDCTDSGGGDEPDESDEPDEPDTEEG